MQTISLDELQTMIDEYEPRHKTDGWGDRYVSGLFIRWSITPEADCKMQYSTNHATGEGELGLSVNEAHYSQTWHSMDTGRTLRERVMEYRFGAGKPWIVEGYRPENPKLMRGSDNEPLVLWPKPIAWIEIEE